ncbi:hypothetical protein C0J52_05208 [Blattella germanica]|nr:hypothetical protein C0J52_05208 [Blattella germanica]
MNIGGLRKSIRSVRPSKINELLTCQSDSDTEDELSHIEYITTPDNKTVEEALTLVDEYDDKFSASQGYCLPEKSPYVPLKPPVPECKAATLEPKSTSKLSDDARKAKRRKKKRKRRVTICTANCKYEVVRRVAIKMGMREVSEEDSWNLYWTDLSVSVERAKEMKRFQKINHFPGMLEICRKDLLARNLNRMLKLFPKEYNIFPKTWCLPADFGELIAYSRAKKNRTYICKPETGCQGRGIFMTKNIKDIKQHDRMVCQIYIARPFLVDGFKFDLRIYALITSCDPLRIYVYNDGLARKISTLTNWLLKKDYDVQDILTNIDDVIIKTVIAAHPILKHSYHACFPSHDFTYACFELLGFDILLDYKLKPYILEVNHSPSFHTDAQIDRDIKESLLQDTFGILNLTHTDKKKILEEDRRRVRERLLQGINHRDSEKYDPFFHQNQSSLFQDTAASRAREECARLQREEIEGKVKAEAARRTGWRHKEFEKLQPESPLRETRQASVIKKKISAPMKKPSIDKKQSFLNSFEPEPIIDSEERERNNAMAQREFLMKTPAPAEPNNTATDRLQSISCTVPLQPLAGLSLTCNNAPMIMRPHIPRSPWLDDGRDVRFTKTHMARSITNTHKLQELEKREQQRH